MTTDAGSPEARSRRASERIARRLMAATLVALAAALVLLSAYALEHFERRLGPQVSHKAEAVGRVVASDIDHALDLGIPLNRLRGMDAYLENVMADAGEVTFVVVGDGEGRVLYAAGPDAAEGRRLVERLHAGDGRHGSAGRLGDFFHAAVPVDKGTEGGPGVHLGAPRSLVHDLLKDLSADVLTVFLVGLFAAYEILSAVLALKLGRPLSLIGRAMRRAAQSDFAHRLPEIGAGEVRRLQHAVNGVLDRVAGRAGSPGETLSQPSLAAMRAPLILFVFGEELSRAFLPLYVDSVYSPVPGLSREMVLGLPIAAFMAAIAVMTLFTGTWLSRAGPRRLFLLAVIPGVAGHVGTALATGIYDLVLWRVLAAVGYAMATMSAQAYILAVTERTGTRASGLAGFVGAVMVAAIAGTSIGAMLADRIGYRPTFVLAAVMVALGGVLFARLVSDAEGRHETERTRLTWRDAGRVLANRRFAGVVVFIAMPAKIILTGFLFFLVPLHLVTDLGASQSATGRIMMAYFVAMVVVAPAVGRLVDRSGRYHLAIAAGGLIAGIGPLVLPVHDTALTVLGAVIALGVGQALSTAPMQALAVHVTERADSDIPASLTSAVLRVMERVGSAVGPFLAGGLVAGLTLPQTAAGLGLLMVVATLVFLAVEGVANGPWPRRAEVPS